VRERERRRVSDVLSDFGRSDPSLFHTLSWLAIADIVAELAGAHHSLGVHARDAIETCARCGRGEPFGPARNPHHFGKRLRPVGRRSRFFSWCELRGSSLRGRHAREYERFENRAWAGVAVDHHLK